MDLHNFWKLIQTLGLYWRLIVICKIVNRELGTVNYISQDTFNGVIQAYIKLHENKAGLKRMNTENVFS